MDIKKLFVDFSFSL